MASVEPQEFASLALRRFSRAEYERLVALGLFEDERVELPHGYLVEMSPPHAPHAHVIRQLHQKLTLALAGRALVQAQCPLALLDDSEPEPDLAVVPLGDYRQAHPTSAHLVVEVADSSQRKDRLVKAPLYAASQVPEYWVVLTGSGTIEVYREPQGGRYARMETVARGGRITLVGLVGLAGLAGLVVSVDDFLP